MDIAYIISMKTGILPYIYREMSEMEKHGFKISIFPTKFNEGPFNPKSNWKVFPYVPINVVLKQFYFLIKNPIKYFILLREALRTNSLMDVALAWNFAQHMTKADLIQCHFGDHKLFIGYYCKKILDKPLFVTIHAYELYDNPNEKLFIRALKYCDGIITISKFNQQLLTEKYDVDSTVVHIGIEPEEFKEKNIINILIVGGLVKYKGHKILLHSIKNLKNIRLWIVGKGEMDAELKVLAKKLKINERVIFFGQVPESILEILYRSCDIFVLPSIVIEKGITEGTPSVIIEAMAMGKPVIATNVAGIPELVKDKSGLLVKAGSVSELRNAIKLLASKYEMRKAMGKRGKKIVEKDFDIKRNTMEIIEIYKKRHQNKM